MTEQIHIFEISKFIGKSVRFAGWIYNKRTAGGIIFLQFRDGTRIIQAVVVRNEVEEEVFDKANKLTLESSVILEGIVKEDKRSPGGFELTIKNLEIIQLADDDYPIGKKEHGIDFLLSHRHLWLRSRRQWSILKIREKVIQEVETFYRSEGFTRIDTPIITPAACEGTTTLFEIDYFGNPAYLSQSGQLYLEAAISSFGKVYDYAPVFRAEKSKTRRHLIEFWMTNCEMAFFDLKQTIIFQEKMIAYLLKVILNTCAEYLKIIDRDIFPLEKIRAPFERITYHRAVNRLQKLGSDIAYGEDLGNDDETLLMKHYQQPIFITHYPSKVKAFYMKKDPQQSDLVLCSDLLVPEGYGEIIGGSQREDDYDILRQSMKDQHLPQEAYSWYLDLRKYGSVPHSGFGLGVERFLAWICGLKHVRESIPFPRLLGRFSP